MQEDRSLERSAGRGFESAPFVTLEFPVFNQLREDIFDLTPGHGSCIELQ